MAGFKYLKGLNSLRFFAAFFVIISHANISLIKLGIYQSGNWAFLNRGEDAVNFFFTLSGFLITYLLLLEIKETGSVAIKEFYLRRIFRIWPLYFLVVTIGFFLLTIIYKKIYGTPYFTFNTFEGLLCFIFFLPNYMAVNYHVGLLYPLWSIGVEEQFYLFWAPLVKFFRKNMVAFLSLFAVLSTIFYCLIYYGHINFSEKTEKFLLTQKFFEMAIGGLFAYLLYKKHEWYNGFFLSRKPVQLMVLAVIVWHYCIGFSFSGMLPFKILCSVLYGLLILNVSVISHKLINLEKPVLNYLGVISYGLYMYHMLVDYVLRTSVDKFGRGIPSKILVPLYYLVLLAGTIGVAAFSYKYFESYFLEIKKKMRMVKNHYRSDKMLQTG
jgi:peptidoglycan/LPS O-acetylase OafA/YrhL